MEYLKALNVQNQLKTNVGGKQKPITAEKISFGAQKKQNEPLSKEANYAIKSNAEAFIKRYDYNPNEVHTYVAKEALDPNMIYLRQNLLERAGVFDDDPVECLTKPYVQVDSSKKSKFLQAKDLNIENFAITADNKGIRGGSPFSVKGRKAMARLKDYGIKRVIDLRVDGDPEKYKEMCAKSGLEYFKFPITYDEKWTQENINKIPEFVDEMNKGNFYIGCATGLHRTDTGLAIYYFFNPKQTETPKIEAGTTKNKTIAIMNKIMAAVNDICYSDKAKTQPRLDDAFAKKLGWESLDCMLNEIQKRKVYLCEANNIL